MAVAVLVSLMIMVTAVGPYCRCSAAMSPSSPCPSDRSCCSHMSAIFMQTLVLDPEGSSSFCVSMHFFSCTVRFFAYESFFLLENLFYIVLSV